MTDSYTPEDQKLAYEAAIKLGEYAATMSGFMPPHAVATAFMSVAASWACKHLSPMQAAAWLRGVADEVAAHGAAVQDKGFTH